MTYVYLNGKLIGTCSNPEELVKEFRELRRRGEIDYQVTIAYYKDTDEIHVNTDAGRVIRPLIIVENGKPKLTVEHLALLKSNELKWSDLINQGIIEYLDAEEEENAYIAMRPEDVTEEHTHLEIDPCTIFGICANLVPYLQHNQASRVSIGANMTKQAIGLYASNYLIRMDTQRHILHYPQVPLIKTKGVEVANYSNRPAGQNLVIAVLSYEGYNMEDALIFNKASIERGAGRSTSFRCYKTEEIRYPGGQQDKVCIPEKDVRGYRSEKAYRALGEDGLAEVEFEVETGDVVIGKTSPPRFLEAIEELTIAEKRRESSEAIKPGEEGIVDTVMISQNLEGDRLVKVKVRSSKVPELGDKFASRHGQKGVIGLIVPEEDMPFTVSGIVPDIIINPHAIPSRMTIAHLIEMLAGKVAALQGKFIDATPFGGKKEGDLRKLLKDLGFKSNGKEVMIDGRTGRMYEVEIFIGICYYEKLKHIVSDKIRARSRGPIQVLTRQPTEGKAREGGLRLGEMEKDCFVGHGAALLLKERLLEESDKTTVPVCANCGMVAIYDKRRDVAICPLCGDKADVHFVEMAYAFKLLLDELKSACVYPKLILSEIE